MYQKSVCSIFATQYNTTKNAGMCNVIVIIKSYLSSPGGQPKCPAVAAVILSSCKSNSVQCVPYVQGYTVYKEYSVQERQCTRSTVY